MKIRLIRCILAIVLLPLPLAAAFHDQEGNCSSCHVAHNSIDGVPVAPGIGNEYQLLADKPSDVCLLCHAQEAGSVLGLNPLVPPPEKGGGNFVFLFSGNINDAPDGLVNPIPGDAGGHNLVAPGHGLAADPRYVVSPGGDFPANELGCTSCHDPHARDTFRMLYGVGPVQDGLTNFTAPAPAAIGIELTADRERPGNHAAYIGGMSLWCANCHGLYHDEGAADFEHPVDETFDTDSRLQYNRYEGEGDPLGGVQAFAYLPEVPFEDASADVGSRAGPTLPSKVMCLSCHRAHATSAPASLRWDPNVALLGDDGVVSRSYPIPDPYAHPSQGTLCRKCHEVVPSTESGGDGDFDDLLSIEYP